jgi:hypothetical protein
MSRRKPTGTDTCPMCCHAENLPPLRMLPLRDLVSVARAWELTNQGGDVDDLGGGYTVFVDGYAVALVGSPEQVKVEATPERRIGRVPGTPLNSLSGRLCILTLRAKGLLHWALTGEDLAGAVTRADSEGT